jgi:CheY-like chemotaxis protein
VAITGTMRAEDVALRQNCGINDVVYKPLDEHQLCVCLSQLLQEANNRGRA